MANPRKFSEKIALHNQKQAEETAAFEKIMREVSDATNKVNSGCRRSVKVSAEPTLNNDSSLRPIQNSLGSFRSGSLPNVAAPQATNSQPEEKPEETTLATQYGIAGARSGGTSPSRNPVQRGRTSSSVGPMRRPADRKHDTSPYGSTVYLSPPPDSNWRRTNSDSALHQSCGGEQQGVNAPLSPHHQPHHQQHHPHQNHRRPDINLDVFACGMSQTKRPRSSCEIPRIPNDNNFLTGNSLGGSRVYGSGEGGGAGASGAGGGGLCADMQVPGGSLPDLTAYRPRYPHPQHHAYPHNYSPTSPGAVSPGGGSVSPATGGLSPASGSPVGATVPLAPHTHQHDHTQLYEAQNHLSVPNTNNYLHHNKNLSSLDQSWMTSTYQSNCSPPSPFSSTSNINNPSPTMVHSPDSPVESPQTADYSNFHQAILQPFEQITMDWAHLVQSLVESGWTAHVQVAENLDHPSPSYNQSYMNPSSSHTSQTTNSTHTYTPVSLSSEVCSRGRDPVPGGAFSLQPLPSPAASVAPATPATPPSIPDIILTDYSGELDAGMFCGEEAQLRAGLDLDDLSMLDDPSAMLPDSAVEHEFRLDRLDRL